MDNTKTNLKAAETKQSQEQLRQEIERQKCMHEALIQQNIRLLRSESNLKTNLEQEELKTIKFSQKLIKGIISDVIDFIEDETAKDFHIIINEREFPVHKFILKARSPTLAEVLTNNPDAHDLILTDINENVFEKILQFLYTDELPRDGGIDYLNLFTAAGELKIEDLKHFAGVKACNYVVKENAVDVLFLSTKYEHDVLKNCAFDEIKKFYPTIKFDNHWIRDTSKIIEAIEKFEKKRVSRIPVRVSVRE
ncbi:unnamed protein product [Chironomus riparius]|uniref:BTB domain-containing protein n=1 Tax=Chironomus riparius TaxID=315576 RepID=A0A9N9S151_9DIPT|nr:unnamed protein product [Chironomus riparius]